jgi:tetratricopeptide (TPR) repeat protein
MTTIILFFGRERGHLHCRRYYEIMNNPMIMQSAHRDVLEANPDSDESKARLVEELQSRGRAAVGAKSWMDAKLLYEKALTIAPQERIAVLESNLSLVNKNMGNFEDARKCAKKSTEADSSYVKGWWRLGQALQSLHRSQEALEALLKAKKLDPSNKALVKEYQKVEKKAEEEKRAEEEEKLMELEPPAEEEKIEKTTTSTKTSSAPNFKSSTETKKKDNAPKKKSDDETIFSKSDAVRGYKVVNGKKTSYFHNELTEEAKNLIGDIAPKKIDTTQPVVAANAPGGASAWNKAGTWEEKNVTKWATESLKKQVTQTTFSLPESSPAPGALVTVTEVKTIDGHASVALARGKTRYIYEFLLKLNWVLEGANGLKCEGSLAIPDIDGTIDLGEGYEIHEFCIDSVSGNNIRPLIDRFVHRGGFHEALNESIDDWVRLFKKEYGSP